MRRKRGLVASTARMNIPKKYVQNETQANANRESIGLILLTSRGICNLYRVPTP